MSMEKELVAKLRDAGERLQHFPTDVDQLISLLDEVAILLENVEQSPSQSIQAAYSKLMKVLLTEPLLRHTDVDVQVSVASCISEITRITAPEAPYEDDRMKEVFQLIVSSFAGLSDKSSRSYLKRASILDTVAKIRSCVVMLDLECDGLISEMFQHFLNSIRDDHPKNIFESMVTIMTLVLEESEDVSIELLMPLLNSLKRGTEDVPSIARKLGESVFLKCAVKLKPCLKQAVKSLDLSLDGYSKIVTTICSGSNGEVDHDDGNVSVEQVDAKERFTEEACLEEVPREVQGSMESVISNRTTDIGDEEMLNVSDSIKKSDESTLNTKPLDANINKVDKDDVDTVNLVKVDAKQDRTACRGRKPCSTKPSEPTHIDSDKEATHIDSDKEAEIIFQKASDKETDGSPGLGKDAHISLDEDPRASPDQQEPPLFLPGLLESEVNLSSLSPNKSLPDKSPSKVGVSEEKTDTLAQELASVDSAPKKAIDGTSGMEFNPESHLEQKKLNLAQEGAVLDSTVAEEVADVNSDSENKSQKQHGMEENFVKEHESSENLHAVIVAPADGGRDSEIEAQEFPWKNKGNLGQEDEPCEDLISPKLSDDSEKLSGKKKVNLVQEDVTPVSLKVDGEISDFKDKSQRRSGKKAVRTKKVTSCVMKGNMLKGRRTSKNDIEDNSEEEEIMESAKEGSGSDSETKPLVRTGKDITSGRRGRRGRPRGRPLEKCGKVDVLETRLSNKRSETTNEEGRGSGSHTDGDGSGSETKALLRSGKGKTSRPPPLKKSGKGYVSEAKLSGQKEDETDRDKDSLNENSRRTVHMKNKKERVLSKSNANDDDQGMIASPVSTPRPFKDKDPKENSKRKRMPGEDKDKVLVSEDIEYGANLVGAKVKVWWPHDKQYYEGIIESFDSKNKKHKVSYTDGDVEVLVLQKEKWLFVDDGKMQEEVSEDSDPNSSAKSHSRKKAKRNPEQSSKQKQMDASPRSGAAATSKSKGSVTKSSGKRDSKSKDKSTSTTIVRSEENWESDDKSTDDEPGALEENEIKSKSRLETPKIVTKGKGKNPQSGNRSNSMGKAKSGSSKLREGSNSKGKPSASGKTPETAEVKSADTSKAGKRRGKSGKKRRRGF